MKDTRASSLSFWAENMLLVCVTLLLGDLG